MCVGGGVSVRWRLRLRPDIFPDCLFPKTESLAVQCSPQQVYLARLFFRLPALPPSAGIIGRLPCHMALCVGSGDSNPALMFVQQILTH